MKGTIKLKTHKNQIVITTLALLLAVVGYISYDYKNSAFNKESIPASATEQEVAVYNENDISDTEAVLNAGETVLTSAQIDSAATYCAEVKLNREQERSKNKDALLEIVNNQAVTDEQKQNAVDELVRLTEVAQMEADAEMLLEAKGFNNVVVSINDNCCDVVLDMGDDTESARAQVEDVIKRKTDITAENIVITPLNAE